MTVVKKLLIAAGAVLLTLDTGTAAQAAQLASGTLEISYEAQGFNIPLISDSFELTTRLGSLEAPFPTFPSVNDIVLFNGTIVTTNDVGRIFTATNSTDPKFDSFISLLTNRQKNGIAIFLLATNFSAGAGTGKRVENFFTSTSNNINFSDDIIDSISIQLNALQVTNTIAANGLINKSFFANVTLSVNGQPSSSKTVYEPASISGLFLVGILSTMKMQKRKHKSPSSVASI